MNRPTQKIQILRFPTAFRMLQWHQFLAKFMFHGFERAKRDSFTIDLGVVILDRHLQANFRDHFCFSTECILMHASFFWNDGGQKSFKFPGGSPLQQMIPWVRVNTRNVGEMFLREFTFRHLLYASSIWSGSRFWGKYLILVWNSGVIFKFAIS